MPTLPPERFAPLSALGLGEKDAWLYETRRHDGLAPTQIVRRWGGPGHGLPETAMAALSARLDAAADADADAPAVLVPALGGAGAYVANPRVEGVPHPGLWRGGPVLVQFDRQSVPKDRFLFLEQTLTMVHHAGEWSVGEDGAPVLAAAAPATVPRVRPALRDTRSPDAPLVADWTGSSGEVEATIRDWTEESRDALLAATPEQLGLPAGWSAAERRFETDPATGTGVLVLRCVRRTVWEIFRAADLLAADHRLEPARREAIRNFGLGAPSGGEAPRQGRGFAWTRAAEWRNVSRASVPRILGGSIDMDGVGRSLLGDAAPAWRTLLRETLPQDDGLVTLRVTWQRPDLDASPREPVATDRSNPAGWGDSAGALVPTVPLSDAPARAAAIAPPAGSVLAGVSVDEREGGAHADIRVQSARVWKYDGSDDPPNLPVWRGLSAPEIEWRPNLCDGRGGVALVWRRVARASQDAVVARAMGGDARAALPGAELRRLRLSGNGDGSEDITAEYSSRLAVAEFSRVVSGDYFANVYRREYDGLSISDAGAAADQDGAPVRILDALGNEVPTRGVGAHTVLFRPGVRITADFRRDDECKWHVSVTTEVAVFREWEYEWETRRGGHPVAVRVRVWRNAPERPAPPAAPHGEAPEFRDDLNAFGLHDGQAEVRPDIHEERRVSVSDSAAERAVRRDTMHTSGQSADSAAAAPGHAVTKTVTTHSDGLQDVSETDEEGKPARTDMSWSERRAGHEIAVRQSVHQNAAAMPAVPSGGGRASASASVNRFGRIDATVRTETDVYETSRRTVSASPMERTERTDTLVEGAASPNASAQDGQIVTESVTTYSDGKHDHSRTVEEAREKTVRASWNEKRSGHDISVHMESRHNVRDVAVSAGDNERVSVSASANRFGLLDARVQRETDVWPRREREERETAFERTVRETVRADGAASAPASQTTSELKSGSVVSYSDDKHDTVTATVTPKPQSWSWTWPCPWRDASGAAREGTGHGFGYRNWPDTAAPAAPAAPSGAVMRASAHWQMNEFGLHDGTVTFTPESGGTGADSRLYTTAFWFRAQVRERCYEKETGRTLARTATYRVHVVYCKTQGEAYSRADRGGPGSRVDYDPAGGGLKPWKSVKFPVAPESATGWEAEG